MINKYEFEIQYDKVVGYTAVGFPQYKPVSKNIKVYASDLTLAYYKVDEHYGNHSNFKIINVKEITNE